MTKTFDEYSPNALLLYIERQLETASRIDLVWDNYRRESLKGHTRENHSHVALSGNWQQLKHSNSRQTTQQNSKQQST